MGQLSETSVKLRKSISYSAVHAFLQGGVARNLSFVKRLLPITI